MITQTHTNVYANFVLAKVNKIALKFFIRLYTAQIHHEFERYNVKDSEKISINIIS